LAGGGVGWYAAHSDKLTYVSDNIVPSLEAI